MFNYGDNSPTYIVLKVLTSDCFITGYLGSKWDISLSLINPDQYEGMVLQNARIAPLHPAEGQPATFDVPMALIYYDDMIAIIPGDDRSLSMATKENHFFGVPVPADIYAGPYLIKGSALSAQKSMEIFRGQSEYPVKDAEISCIAPDAAFTPIKAPYLLVMGRYKKMLIPKR